MSNDQRFFDYLKRRIGLDVASVGPAIIERAVRQRCTALKVVDNDLYWQHLISSEDEQQALIESVIVPETWFFRYPESFATLGRLATKRLADMGSRRTLRILSLPCSTGEEPYSIAMALFDAGLSAHQFSVQALDVSPYSVQKAQRAQYGKNSFRGREYYSIGGGFVVDEGAAGADRIVEDSTALKYPFKTAKDLLRHCRVLRAVFCLGPSTSATQIGRASCRERV